jgi:hypothetical protein
MSMEAEYLTIFFPILIFGKILKKNLTGFKEELFALALQNLPLD